MLRAYSDASNLETGTFCVAAIAFGEDRAKKAERAWRGLMGERIAHITDMHARKKAFADISASEADTLIRGQVQIIREHASFGVAISCDKPELAKLLPSSAEKDSLRLLDGFRMPYATCCHLAMHSMSRISAENGRAAGIAYVFEKGDDAQSQSASFIEGAVRYQPMKAVYQYQSHGYFEKRDARLMEAADLLAWEWAHQIDRSRNGRHVRASLSHMLEGDVNGIVYKSHKWIALHVTGSALERFCDKVGRLLLATDRHEIESIANSCKVDLY